MVNKIYSVPIETLQMLIDRMNQQFKKEENEDNQKLISGYIQGLQASISVLEQERDFIYNDTPLEHIEETLDSFREFISDENNHDNLDPELFIKSLEDQITKIKEEHEIYE